jgi:hypothetical protein
VLRFPTALATRVYDDATQLWHERGYWDGKARQFIAWTPRVHMQAFGFHLVGDATTDVIAIMDQRYLTERDGSVIRRLRVAPVLRGEGERVFLDRVELFLEAGLNPNTNPTADPLVSLQVSYDGGKTWGNERFVGAGRIGQYGRRLVWARCGSGASVQARFVCTDPTAWNVMDCFIDGSGISQLRGPRTQGNEAAA